MIGSPHIYQFHDDTLCVRAPGVVISANNPEGLVSLHTWKDWTRRNGAKLVQRGGNGRVSLIAFNSLPAKYKELLKERFGDPMKNGRKTGFARRVQPDKEAARFFLEYLRDNGEHLPERHRSAYTINACIFNAMKVQQQEMRQARARKGRGMNGYWQHQSQILESLRSELGHTLPKNPVTLKRKYELYLKAGYTSLVSAKFDNRSAAKITPEIEAWFIKEMAYTRQSVEMIHLNYFSEAQRQGWRDDITAAAFRALFSQPRVRQLIEFKRHGKKSFRQKNGQTFKLKRPVHSNDIWVSDGTGLNWYFRNKNNELGMACTYVVMDAKSWKFLGWSTKEAVFKEDFNMQMSAYRMAIRNANTKPYQLLFDNQGGHKKPEARNFYNILAHQSFPTQPYRPSGKPIEQGFKRFQALMLTKYPFWSGYGRQSHSTMEHAPNTDDLKKNIHLLPDYDQVVQLLEKVILQWNDLAANGIESPNKIYEDNRSEQEQALTIDEHAELFWNVAKERKYMAHGIKMQVNNEVKWYEVYTKDGDVDYDFRRKYLHQRFHVKYDPDGEYPDVELLQVHPTGGFTKIATASPKREISRSVKEITPIDHSWTLRQMKLEEEMLTDMDNEAADMGIDDVEKYSTWQVDLGVNQPVMADDDEEDDPVKLLRQRM